MQRQVTYVEDFNMATRYFFLPGHASLMTQLYESRVGVKVHGQHVGYLRPLREY